MIVSGDETGRTQMGNNNAYCQDNEISWINWAAADLNLLNFTSRLIHFYKNHPVFTRKRWFKGVPIKGVGLEDIAWFLPDGNEMSEDAWKQDFAKSLGVYLNGRALRSVGKKGEPIIDDNFYIIFNAAHHGLFYKLPHEKFGHTWIKIIDTHTGQVDEPSGIYRTDDTIEVSERSIVVLKQPLS